MFVKFITNILRNEEKQDIYTKVIDEQVSTTLI